MRRLVQFLVVTAAAWVSPLHVAASPFVNVTPHPELSALQRVASVGETQKQQLPDQPALVLNFAPEHMPAALAPRRGEFSNLWERLRAGFAIPDLPGKEVREADERYAARAQLVARIFERSRPYLFHIVQEVEKRGMPAEIALLPFIESGFDPNALSSAQALGLWQFIPGTATRYKLGRGEAFDARRHVVASTTAALDYLQFLHGMFGDWMLALAGYNWGEEAVARAIERNRARGLPTDYASLTLPAETRQYVPKLLAVKRIVTGEAPLLHVALPPAPNRPYFATVGRAGTVNIAQAARFADMQVDEFRQLNAAHSESVMTISAELPFVVPADREATFIERLNEFLQKKAAVKPTGRVKATPRRM